MRKTTNGGFTCTPIGKKVFQIQLTHFSYRLVNAYLLADDPITLIDTGHLEADSFINLEQALATAGCKIDDIACIIYTHPHIDHLGGGVAINERNPSVYHVGFAGAVDAFKNQKRYNVALTENAHRFFDTRGAKAPPEHVTEVKRFFTDYLLCNETTGIALTKPVEDGMVVPAGGFELQVLHTPAHTPWDISLYEPRHGLLFSGDVLLEKVVSLYSTIISSDFDSYGSALERIEKLRLTTILPGHGMLIKQPYKVLANWNKLLARRTAKITALLQQGTGDVYDIVGSLLADQAEEGDALHRLMGFVDTYLMKLVQDGKADQVWEEDKVRYVWKK